MKKALMACLVILIAGIATVSAQNHPPANDFANQNARRPDRNDVLRKELRLTQQQSRQIRMINRRLRPAMRLAQQRLRFARQELDAAIYADLLDEELVKNKVHAMVEAQANVTKLRIQSEMAVRKVLDPEQLERFRALRRRFARQGRAADRTREEREKRQRMKEQETKERQKDTPPIFR